MNTNLASSLETEQKFLNDRSNQLQQKMEFDVLSFEIEQERSREKSLEIPIAVSVELEFNCYLHTVHYGEAALGTYSKSSETGLWEAYPIHNNPLDLKTYHETSIEARSAIVSAYLKQPVTLPEVRKVKYLVSLCTEEVDEYGAPWGHNEIVELDAVHRVSVDEISTTPSMTKNKPTSVKEELDQKQEELGLRKRRQSVLPESDRLDELQHSNPTDIDDRPFANPPIEPINPKSVINNLAIHAGDLGKDDYRSIGKILTSTKPELIKDVTEMMADTEEKALAILETITSKYPNLLSEF